MGRKQKCPDLLGKAEANTVNTKYIITQNQIIPQAFKPYQQFVIHRAKIPIHPATLQPHDPHDPGAWLTADQALQYAAAGYNIGFVFTEADPFFFFDIDGCHDGANWSQLATDMCRYFQGCYIEVSVSGTGLHIFGSGQYKPHACKNVPLGLEFYTSKRFVALTGTGARGCASHSPQHITDWLIDNYFPATAAADPGAAWTDGPCQEWNGITDDEALVAKMLSSRSATAILGGRASVRDLWTANADTLAEVYPSQNDVSDFDHSSADAALCQHLAFWTGKDCERMDRLMQQSALVRDKWLDREDYRQATILHAVSHCSKVYGEGHNLPSDPPSISTRKGFSFIRADKLISDIKPTEWLIKDILEAKALSVLFGAPGSFKSFLGLAWALSVATGTPWFGHDVIKGIVFIIIGEGHSGYGKRIAAWAKSNGVGINNDHIYISNSPIMMLDESSAKECGLVIDDLCQKHGKPSLVVLDTLARNFGPGDENNTSDMTKFIMHLDHYLGTNFTRLIIHHTGHGDQTRGRGSSVLKGAADSEYCLRTQDNRILLSCSKMKDAEPFKEIHLSSQLVPIGNNGLEPITSLVLNIADSPSAALPPLSPQMHQALNILDFINRKNGISCMSNWRDICMEENIYTKSAFYNSVKTMESKGIIKISNSYVKRS